jgi:hypothetical protein
MVSIFSPEVAGTNSLLMKRPLGEVVLVDLGSVGWVFVVVDSWLGGCFTYRLVGCIWCRLGL